MNDKKIPKFHYFDCEVDKNDIFLQMSIQQGYVPKTCRLGGQVVWALVCEGKDPCKGCSCDRTSCHGRSFQ